MIRNETASEQESARTNKLCGVKQRLYADDTESYKSLDYEIKADVSSSREDNRIL